MKKKFKCKKCGHEFDKWWVLEAQNIVGVGRNTEEDVAKITWKAALEWALNRESVWEIEKELGLK